MSEHVRVYLSTYDFSDAREARKITQVKMRPAEEGQHLITVIRGNVETDRILPDNQVIVTNPTGEEYAMSYEKFLSRYEEVNGEWMPRGRARALMNLTGRPVVITAPWGEDQFGDERCVYLAAVNPDGSVSETDRYICDWESFIETYEYV